MKQSAKKHHYVYALHVKDDVLCNAFMDSKLPWLYVGVRSCNCPIAEDQYMGSSEYVRAAMESGVEFSKEVREVFKTRTEANRREKEMISNFKYADKGDAWWMLFNRVVPGEFGAIKSRMIAVRQRVGANHAAKGSRGAEWHLHHPVESRKGGGKAGQPKTEAAKVSTMKAITRYWEDMRAFAGYHGIRLQGKGAPNINRESFKLWRASLVLTSCQASSTVGG